MARSAYETNTRVFWLPTVASAAAPTVANITAGTELTSYVTKDGVRPPGNQNMVDSATIADSFDAQGVGSWGGGAFELKMYRDKVTADDDAWVLMVYQTTGFLLIARTGLVIATSKVEVWPAQMHNPVMDASAANEQQKFTAAFAITAAPTLNATVAA